MPRFMVESYAASSPTAFEDARERARLTAELGTGVSYVQSTFVPGDETVLHLFDARSERALEKAARSAGLQFERIVQAVSARLPDERRSEDAG